MEENTSQIDVLSVFVVYCLLYFLGTGGRSVRIDIPISRRSLSDC